MSIYQPLQINNDVLCVLKKRANGEFFITYEKLTSPIQEAISSLELKLRYAPQGQALQIYQDIMGDRTLKVLFDYHSSFSENLWEPW